MNRFSLIVLLVGLLVAVPLLGACQPNLIVVTVTPAPEGAAVAAPTEEPAPTEVPPTEVPPTAVPPTEIPPTEVPPTEEPATEITTPIPEPEPTGEPAAEAAVVDINLPIEQGELFATAGQCAVCHTMMTDEAGQDVSLDSQWRSSMMANAAIDPYWQAGVRNEVMSNPDHAEFIQDKCSTCHMPMARTTYNAHEEAAIMFGEGGMLDPVNELHTLARDGISCTVCHQFDGEALASEDSHSGHYVIDFERPKGERLAFGSFEVSETDALVMQATSGFVPSQVDYMQDSEVCGVCHTLYTPSLNKESEIVGEFAEQMVYPEWRHSAFAETDSCQGCHMPTAEGAVKLATTSMQTREPFNQHVYVGGNFYMPELLRQHQADLGLKASDEHVDATIAQVMDQLQNNTAILSVDDITVADSLLTADLTVTSLVGHKYPTSYPARRTWLHVTVTDAAGAVIFESGAFNADGSITGNANDEAADEYEPHYSAITAPDEVQIYEAIMSDVDGLPTTTLLFGAGYLKDNRMLPDGFDKTTAPPDFQVWGLAEADEDFIGGSDLIQYQVDVSGAEGPFTITAEMLYQGIAFRWAHNLAQHDAYETNRFLAYYMETPSPAALVTSISATAE